MRRAIKFRGKANDGRWIYGGLVYSDNIEPAIYFEVGNKVYKRMDWAYVDQATVGQFTGLFDEDGREIYEGDIIKIVEEFDDENVYTRIGVVCFEEGMYELQDKNGKHFAYLGWLMHNDDITKLEVIGNIHDNPELLKGGNQ